MRDKIIECLPEIYSRLSSEGLFLTTGTDRPNAMIVGWGGINVYFGKPIFIVPVRTSRHTHEILERSQEFTVSVPDAGTMKEAISFCGTKSGRDFDKFKECGLTPVAGRKVEVPVIGECGMHFECRIIYKQHMAPENLDKAINEKVYHNSDYHTLYYGEIIDFYETR